tara:strand:+ start:1370 stop:1966 length:597 start_codon:yes stop_codon:yes gene_type:complete
MFKQSVILFKFNKLYNILKEIEYLFKFNLVNFQNPKELEKEIELNNQNISNSIFIFNNKSHVLSSFKEINKNNILVIDEIPLKIQSLFDKINIKLIKQKYNLQSKLIVKDYFLDLNSRIISIKEIKLKLTEREIDIILFLNDNRLPKSVEQFQNEVWGHSTELETHTVETHIYRLRKKIKEKFNDDRFIVSTEKGYKI